MPTGHAPPGGAQPILLRHFTDSGVHAHAAHPGAFTGPSWDTGGGSAQDIVLVLGSAIDEDRELTIYTGLNKAGTDDAITLDSMVVTVTAFKNRMVRLPVEVFGPSPIIVGDEFLVSGDVYVAAFYPD
jgi:hypothetical protein